jgi:uncharacterized protein (DUF924 family)
MNNVSVRDFYKAWFTNPNWWFKASTKDDSYIREHYECLLNQENVPETIDETLACVLLYDQLPRHVLRHTQSNHILTFYLQKALAFSSQLSSRDLQCLKDEEWCFAMLPWRHTQDPRLIEQVCATAWKRYKTTQSYTLHKFIKATYEHWPTCDQTMFIHKYYPTRCREIPLVSHSIAQVFCEAMDPRFKYILSLSGGVDSMVCSVLLANHRPAIDYEIVHINYNNRDTSLDEENFVIRWACTVLGKRVHVRRLKEINRPTCMKHQMRTTYESYTRNVRYNCYRHVHPDHPRVILGHNKDDCLENIFQK